MIYASININVSGKQYHCTNPYDHTTNHTVPGPFLSATPSFHPFLPTLPGLADSQLVLLFVFYWAMVLWGLLLARCSRLLPAGLGDHWDMELNPGLPDAKPELYLPLSYSASQLLFCLCLGHSGGAHPLVTPGSVF